MKFHGCAQAALHAIDAALASPVAKPFSFPVTNAIAPEYSSVIKRPMDLSKVRGKLAGGDYATANEAYADLCLVGSKP